MQQTFFEKSIDTLFWLGQLPVIVISWGTFLFVHIEYAGKGVCWSQGAVLALGFFALVLSLAAVTRWKTSEKTSIILLAASLVTTLVYLTLLVRVTHGSISPFQSLYLYLPAIVFMVAQKRIWAELVASIGVLGSYIYNYDNPEKWIAWKQFHTCNWYHWYEKAFVAILLLFLILVNHRMEALEAKNVGPAEGVDRQ